MTRASCIVQAALAEQSDEWALVANLQKEKDELSRKLYALPVEQFRAAGYRPPPIPPDSPTPGKDLDIVQTEVEVRDGTKILIRIYTSTDHSPGSLLFFNAHGGGFVTGNTETEEAQNRLIAVKNGAVVVSVDYRRAPEYPYPFAVNDCFDVLIWCRKNADSLNIDPQRIIVGGGSAGANLSTVLALKFRNLSIPGIIGQILNIPVTCHPACFPQGKYEYISYKQNKNSPIVDANRMYWFWNQYLPDATPDPYASPLLAESLHGLPPTLVQVAGMDPLRDEGIAYAQALKKAGVSTTLRIYAGLPHAFYIYPQLPSTAVYLTTMVDWIATNFQGCQVKERKIENHEF
ncbi:lipase esterase family protein [Talaromyces proteolyticus]|uniref:Lipase esterase family protein n=1 Tax=Talaromyces proteolyticus TaxID=1131652 RepID=A0AAD4Q097_9EURO|nr:lipase esterase family protein [Talaromyces proteolyticus]KAH8703863.1 lipase esterase family protein [Talaromyces proteolyticus]